MIRAQGNQSVGAQMLTAATGAAFAGTVTVYITIDAGAQTIGSVGAGLCTLEGNGYYTYQISQAETDGAKVDCTFIGTGAIPTTIQYPTITLAQQAALVGSSVSGAVSVEQICADAANELNILMAGGTLSGNQALIILRRLNWIFDAWNADRQTIYSVTNTSYPLTPSLNPHTIGPSSATFTVTQRPVSIEAAHLVLTGTYPPRVPIYIERDPKVWAAWSTPTMASAIPTRLYYDASWPNGKIYFNYVPTTAYAVELLVRGLLAQVVLTDMVTLPPGYIGALTLTLAEWIASPFGAAVPADVVTRARQLRAVIGANNDIVPRLITADAGMPGSTGRGGYNYLTGTWS